MNKKKRYLKDSLSVSKHENIQQLCLLQMDRDGWMLP